MSPSPAVPSSGDPDPTPRHRRHTRRPLVIGAFGLLVIAGGAFALQPVTSDDEAAQDPTPAAADPALQEELGELRTRLAGPTRDGHAAATELVRHQVSELAGDRGDAERTEELIADLRAAADELRDAVDAQPTGEAEMLQVATTDPIRTRLDGIEQQTIELSDRFAASADEAEAFEAAVRSLDDAATAYADGAAVPSGSTPDEIAAAWRDELDRLDTYAAALDHAREVPVLERKVDAHTQLIAGMRALAEDALTHLEDDDLDAHNARLEDALDREDPFEVTTTLQTARSTLAQRWAEGPLHRVRGEALGLLTELERLTQTARG